MKEIIQAIKSLENSLPETFDGEIRLNVDDYNLVAQIWEALDSIQNSLKKIEAKM